MEHGTINRKYLNSPGARTLWTISYFYSNYSKDTLRIVGYHFFGLDKNGHILRTLIEIQQGRY